MRLNLLDIVGKSIAHIELDSLKSNIRSKTDLVSQEKVERMATFDIMIENAAKTKYPANINRNNLNVIPSSVDLRTIRFNKKVCYFIF